MLILQKTLFLSQSDRKWGAMHLSNLGTVFLGAPEMLLQENPTAVVEAQGRGSRVLVLAHSSEQISMQELKPPENLGRNCRY